MRTRKHDIRYLSIMILSPAILLAGWVLAAQKGWVSATLLSPPWEVVQSAFDLFVHGYSGVPFSEHFAASLSRVGIAFVVGGALGVGVGLLRATYRDVDALWLIPSEILRPIPQLGLVPIFILWFGIGELSKVLLILLSVFLVTMVSAQAGAAATPGDVIRAASSLGAKRWQTFLYVILPSALPQIMTGLRVAMGLALSILVAAELLGGDRGLGFVVLDATNFFRTSYVFAGVLIIGLIGLLTDRAFVWISRRWVHWQ